MAATSRRYADVDYEIETSSTLGDVHRSQFPNFEQHYNAELERKWQVDVQRSLVRLVNMKKGWDSYEARPIRRDAGFFALELLQQFMRNRTPAPQVVPTSAGGIQLEWHEKGIDLELHITAPYECEVWFQDHRDPLSHPLSIRLSDDFSALTRPIQLLTSR
jgi:hypothetical protein